ncbi:hypothetical protein J2W46_005769 [Paraburkholderia strydomiana]|nr:hypothetical protein [Paraburkholderia strydomiana]
MQIAAENIADKTLIEVVPDSRLVFVSFDKLAAGAEWDDDVEYHFRCLHCNEAFGCVRKRIPVGGGYWNR